MPTETQNYRLVSNVVSDDFVEPAHVNRLADTVDRVLGSCLLNLVTAGVNNGWTIETNKQVSAGAGLVRACWCSTSAPQDIIDLTDDAVNYVFAEATSSSGWDGSVVFRAQLSSSGPSGSVLLGSIELDEDGNVVAVDNTLDGVDRQCYRLSWEKLGGSGSVTSVPAGESEVVVIEHAALRVPGAIEFEVDNDDFTWGIDRTWEADGFRVTLTNTAEEAADTNYTWTRCGIGE